MSVGTRGTLYVLSYAIGVLFLLLITIVRRKIYKTPFIRALVYGPLTFLLGFCGAKLIGLFFSLINVLAKNNAYVNVDVIGAVIFTSPLLLAAVYIEKAIVKHLSKRPQEEGKEPFHPWAVSFRDTMDLVIPGAFVVFACIKIGCAFRGCCFGVECSWGFPAQFLGDHSITLFPVQVFESASLFAIAAGSHYVQRAGFYRRGMSGPFAAFLYGAARFFWEFFRWYTPENRHFFLGLSLWQSFCLLILLVAGVWLAILLKTQPAEPREKVRLIVLPQRKKKKTKARSSIKAKDLLPSFTFGKKEKNIVHANKKKNGKKKR